MPTSPAKHQPHRVGVRTHRPRQPEREHKRRVYTSQRWVRERALFLKQNPLCVHCEQVGRITPANTVDHVIEHCGPQDPLAWDVSNWQPLCQSCHSRKTATTYRGGDRNPTDPALS